MLPIEAARCAFWPLVPAGAVMAVVLGYGYARMAGEHVRPA